jgi:transposase, IS30 family
MKQYTQLTEGERNQIYILNKEGFRPSKIAQRIDRDPSTVSRELKRNRGGCGYRAKQAHDLANRRRSNASSGTRISPEAWAYAIEKLEKEQWSPEQIAGRIEKDIGKTVSHEFIYQKVYEDRKAGGDLHKNLRHGHKKRKKRCNPGAARAGRGHIKNRRDIAERPAHVEKRKTFGHWEIDTIIGKGQSGAAITIVERKSRYTIVIPLKNRLSRIVAEETIKALKSIAHTVKSITADNGKEFAQHECVAEALGLDYYFATPYHSWERGTNENANGLIRQYIPKTASILDISRDDAQLIMNKLNNRPRKILNFQTPAEVLLRHCNQLPILQ